MIESPPPGYLDLPGASKLTKCAVPGASPSFSMLALISAVLSARASPLVLRNLPPPLPFHPVKSANLLGENRRSPCSLFVFVRRRRRAKIRRVRSRKSMVSGGRKGAAGQGSVPSSRLVFRFHQRGSTNEPLFPLAVQQHSRLLAGVSSLRENEEIRWRLPGSTPANSRCFLPLRRHYLPFASPVPRRVSGFIRHRDTGS